MKASDIRLMSVEEIETKIAGETSVLQKLKFSHAISPVENPMRIKEQRKLIARLNTVLTEKMGEQHGN